MQRYQVLSVVGEGAYGVVLCCRDTLTGERVAIKKFKCRGDESHAAAAAADAAGVAAGAAGPEFEGGVGGRGHLPVAAGGADSEGAQHSRRHQSEHGAAGGGAGVVVAGMGAGGAAAGVPGPGGAAAAGGGGRGTVGQNAMREVRILRLLKHPNIVELKDAFRKGGKLYLVFEYVDMSLLDLLQRHPRGLHAEVVRVFVYHLVLALHWCHTRRPRILHRDIKPENLLVNLRPNTLPVLKLCDFGFARTVNSLTTSKRSALTDYVATRWYRAPELLLATTDYGPGVDMWAVGCIMAEMADGEPLFAGDSELDQLHVISHVLGDSRGSTLAVRASYAPHTVSAQTNPHLLDRFPAWVQSGPPGRRTLSSRLSRVLDADAVNFCERLLALDPAARMSATDCLLHPYLAGIPGNPLILELQQQQLQRQMQEFQDLHAIQQQQQQAQIMHSRSPQPQMQHSSHAEQVVRQQLQQQQQQQQQRPGSSEKAALPPFAQRRTSPSQPASVPVQTLSPSPPSRVSIGAHVAAPAPAAAETAAPLPAVVTRRSLPGSPSLRSPSTGHMSDTDVAAAARPHSGGTRVQVTASTVAHPLGSVSHCSPPKVLSSRFVSPGPPGGAAGAGPAPLQRVVAGGGGGGAASQLRAAGGASGRMEVDDHEGKGDEEDEEFDDEGDDDDGSMDDEYDEDEDEEDYGDEDEGEEYVNAPEGGSGLRASASDDVTMYMPVGWSRAQPPQPPQQQQPSQQSPLQRLPPLQVGHRSPSLAPVVTRRVSPSSMHLSGSPPSRTSSSGRLSASASMLAPTPPGPSTPPPPPQQQQQQQQQFPPQVPQPPQQPPPPHHQQRSASLHSISSSKPPR